MWVRRDSSAFESKAYNQSTRVGDVDTMLLDVAALPGSSMGFGALCLSLVIYETNHLFPLSYQNSMCHTFANMINDKCHLTVV